MGFKNFFLIIFMLIFFISCEKPLKENFEGIWEIEELSFKNENYLDKLFINSISFSSDSANLPGTHEFSGDSNAQWKIIEYQNSDSLVITSKNKIFDGRYNLLFATDQNDNSVYAKLISNRTVILLHKVNLGIPRLGNDMFFEELD